MPTIATNPVDSTLYTGLQHFYSRQMQLLDEGRTEEWSATFTDDGVFDASGQVVKGRETIATAAAHVAGEFDKKGIQRRHWIGMVTADRTGDGEELKVRCYALVLEIPEGGDVIVRRSTVCDDVLVPGPEQSGGWLVRHRVVTRDGLD